MRADWDTPQPKPEPPEAQAPPEPRRPADQLLNLPEAATYLSYTPNGLRKIVERSRTKQLGHTTAGATIKFFQPKKCSDISRGEPGGQPERFSE